jgi:hypothetical protein
MSDGPPPEKNDALPTKKRSGADDGWLTTDRERSAADEK